MNVMYVMVIVVVKYIYINILQTIKTVDFHLEYYVQNIWLKRLNHVLKYKLSCDNIFLFFFVKKRWMK